MADEQKKDGCPNGPYLHEVAGAEVRQLDRMARKSEVDVSGLLTPGMTGGTPAPTSRGAGRSQAPFGGRPNE